MQKSMDFSACQLQAGVVHFWVTRSREEQVVPSVVDEEDSVRHVRRGHPFLLLHRTDWTE
jgi:hypothetical protein